MYRDVRNNTPKVSLTIQSMRLLLVAALMLSYPTFLFIIMLLDEDEIYQLIGCLIILLTKEEYDLLKEIIYGNDNKTTG